MIGVFTKLRELNSKHNVTDKVRGVEDRQYYSVINMQQVQSKLKVRCESFGKCFWLSSPCTNPPTNENLSSIREVLDQ